VTPPVIRYGLRFHEVDMALDAEASSELADMIARGEGEMAANQTVDPKPYDQLLDAVRIATAPGKVVLGLDAEGRVLTITGALEHLAVLANVVRDVPLDTDPKAHVHVEYFEDHYYLAESEVSLVLHFLV
jgi:hypothetical protein